MFSRRLSVQAIDAKLTCRSVAAHRHADNALSSSVGMARLATGAKKAYHLGGPRLVERTEVYNRVRDEPSARRPNGQTY